MIKKLLFVFVLFFAITSLTLAEEKVKLPDYENWPFYGGPYSTFYHTLPGGCEDKTIVEIAKIGGSESGLIGLNNYQYRSPEHGGFIDLIENTKGEPWFIYYYNDNVARLYKRVRRLLVFGHRWKYVDATSDEIEESLEVAFQIRNCLFYSTE